MAVARPRHRIVAVLAVAIACTAAEAAPLPTEGGVQAGTTAEAVYGPGVPPGWTVRDGHRSAILVPPGSEAINTDAYGYYVRNQSVSRPGAPNAPQAEHGNAVGLFGVITCEVDGCASWALNPTIEDAIQGGSVVPTKDRRLVGAEFDYSVHGSGTVVSGIANNPASSFAAPRYADSFMTGAAARMDGFWQHAYVSADGAAAIGLQLGMLARTPRANVRSQPLVLNYAGPDGVERAIKVQAVGGTLQVGPADETGGLSIDVAHGPVVIGTTAGAPLRIDGGLQVQGALERPLVTPASSHAPCAPGMSEDDADFHYVCVAPNRWKRVALSDF